MRHWTLIFFLLAGCGGSGAEPAAQQERATLEIISSLSSKKLDEISGLARSHRDPGIFWAVNDDGPAEIHAIDLEGNKLGSVDIRRAKNKNWEDLASFEFDGDPYLLVADIGDNMADRKSQRLYVVKEPKPGKKRVKIAWQIRFRYPDGPRDAEAIAVDTERERILLLSKRDLPPVLYELPLRPAGDEIIEAERIAAIKTLPRPSKSDVQNALFTKDWYWQPTAMDLSPDGRAAVILTYAGVYYFTRRGDESWSETFARVPLGLGLGRLRKAESIAIAGDGGWALITVEQKRAPLARVDLPDAGTPGHAVTIMSFNVENLFDNVDDPGKDDKAYLPIEAKQSDEHKAECNQIEVERWRNECLYLDWSDAAIDYKLGVLADAIRQVDEGRGPDIIAFQEVENASILKQLQRRLDDSGYGEAILLEGDDTRGIDVAFMSRLPQVGRPSLRKASFADFSERAGDTRHVLEATFELPDGSLLTGFAVHFPAPYHPTGMREVAYEHLAALRAALPDDRHAFAAGDFNTTSTEDTDKAMLDRLVRPHWQVAHEFGCERCLGTYYYAPEDNWSFLDMILFSPGRGADTTWRIRADSAWIANRTEAQVSLSGAPARSNPDERRGVSDHWPLVVTIESN